MADDNSDDWKVVAVKEAADLARKFGGFFSGPMQQLSGILGDELAHFRYRRGVRLAQRAGDLMVQSGISEPTKKIPLKVGLPLLNAATLEDDDELQDLWAALLVNAGNADHHVEVQRRHVSMLQEMGSLDAMCFMTLASAWRGATQTYGSSTALDTLQLPDGASGVMIPDSSGFSDIPPDADIQSALWNLVRLSCITPMSSLNGVQWVGQVRVTTLGLELFDACTIGGGGPSPRLRDRP